MGKIEEFYLDAETSLIDAMVVLLCIEVSFFFQNILAIGIYIIILPCIFLVYEATDKQNYDKRKLLTIFEIFIFGVYTSIQLCVISLTNDFKISLYFFTPVGIVCFILIFLGAASKHRSLRLLMKIEEELSTIEKKKYPSCKKLILDSLYEYFWDNRYLPDAPNLYNSDKFQYKFAYLLIQIESKKLFESYAYESSAHDYYIKTLRPDNESVNLFYVCLYAYKYLGRREYITKKEMENSIKELRAFAKEYSYKEDENRRKAYYKSFYHHYS